MKKNLQILTKLKIKLIAFLILTPDKNENMNVFYVKNANIAQYSISHENIPATSLEFLRTSFRSHDGLLQTREYNLT